MRGSTHLICNIGGAAVLAAGAYSLMNSPAKDNDIIEKIINHISFEGRINTSVYIAICIVMFVIGTFLPDCDQKNSKIGKYIHLPFAHRTWTHTIWFLLPPIILAIWFPPFIFMALGIFGHIFMDSFSKQGICWVYPKYESDGDRKYKKHHFLKLYFTGKASEVITAIVTVLICTGATFYLIGR